MAVSDIKYHDIYRYLVKRFNIWHIFNGFASIPVGVNDSYGDEVTIIRASDFGGVMVLLEVLYDIIGGTFQSDEIVTVKHIIVYHDGTRKEVERSYTSTQTKGWSTGTTEVLATRHPTKRCVEIRVAAKTNMSSTSVTVEITGGGWIW
ncbi:MAG: hypothetical protein J7K21_01125 [Desulfurococcales archaeon]|nr:hypothetical protein [Desulfurococcales archaeon]